MPACRMFRELIDSIYFAFGTRKDAACTCTWRDLQVLFITHRFKCHCSFRGILFSVKFIFSLNNTNLLQNCFVFFVVRSLRYPIWSNFRWLGSLGFPWNTLPLMLYYTTLSDFPLPAWCPVDLCQTLKKADLENTDLENVVYVLLEKPWGSRCCSWVNNFLCVFPSLYFSNGSCEPLDGQMSQTVT